MTAPTVRRRSCALAVGNRSANDLRRDGSCGPDIIGLRPEMILATDFFEMRKSFTEIARAVAFEEVGDLGRTESEWSGDEDMHRIAIRFQGQERTSMWFAAFTEQLFRGFLGITNQNLAAIFGNPHEMIGDGIVVPSRFTLVHATLYLVQSEQEWQWKRYAFSRRGD